MAFTPPNEVFFNGEGPYVRVGSSKAAKPTPAPDPFADGAEIRKVANGFMVMPPDRGCGFARSERETFVFADAAEMATWLRKRYVTKA